MAMNIKKLVAIPDQFRNCASPRKKIVSGFGLGFVSFFIVLFVLFFNFSFRNPISNKLFFQGFNISDNSSLIAWSFSFTTTSTFNSSHATQVEQNPKFFESDGAEMDVSLNFLGFDGNDDTHLGNFTGSVKNGSFNGISDKILDLEDTHLKNGVKNGSFGAITKNPNQENGNGSVESVRFDLKIDFKNEKDDNGVKNESVGAIIMNPKQENGVKNGSFNGISDKILDFEDTHLLNGVKNGSFSAITKNPNQENGVKNGSFNGISDKVLDFEDTHLKNGVKKGSLSAITKNPNQENGNGSVESVGFDLKINLMNKTDDNGDGVLKKGGFSEGYNGLITQIKSNNYSKSLKECDIFDGRWVKDDTKPYYPAGSCPFVDRDFNCHLNRRPDDEFLRWKWQPFGCEIPSLNATDFLGRLRGKKLVFVGDSLNRNMWESLVCILRNSLKNKKRVYEISGRHEFKKKGFYAFRFEDYNCTVDFVSSPFLVLESSFKGINGSFETLRLDLMDRTTSMYHDADILVFNTGHWWTHEKTSRGEDYYQEGKHVYPRLKVLDAYTRALSTWARWVDKNIDVRKTQVIFRGYSVTHFRGGQWNSGGQCHKETEPIFNTSHLTKYPSKMRAFDNVAQTMKTPLIYLNISRLTDYRKDGHPSIYRMMYKSLKHEIAAEQSQDCSHWCLPGVPDTWNELLYASLLKVGKGAWKN